MVQKPKIQYVGDFYIHGSEARKLEEQRRLAKTKLPMARLQQMERVYVDPVAIVGIAVAVFMLVVLVMGAMQLKEDWAQYDRMSDYVSQLKKDNADLRQDYHESYDIEDIKTKAVALGLVPKTEIQTRKVTVTIPEPEPAVRKVDEIRWFLEGLFA